MESAERFNVINEFEVDTQIIDSPERLPETVCAMSNSLGGQIEYNGQIIDVPEFLWHKKPVTHNGQVYRRIEGENIISGAWARSLMANRDFSRDDYPVTCELNSTNINAFRNAVISRNGEYRYFTRDEFLRRTGIYSGKYITFAGALMFGECINVTAVLRHNIYHAEASARNIWTAYTDLMLRLTQKLSWRCRAVFREAFINALLHSDYSTDTNINITITSDPPEALIDNPGLVRGDIRNHRLKRIFDLSGITHTHSGVIRLKQDMLNFRTSAGVALEGMPEAVLL